MTENPWNVSPRLWVVGLVFCLGHTWSCVSPRETCKWYETPDSWASLCFLMSDLAFSCPERVAQGNATVEECKQETDLAVLTCVRYVNAETKCSKESDLPIVPKIVNRQMKPDTADFIRWRMARSQAKAVNNQSAI